MKRQILMAAIGLAMVMAVLPAFAAGRDTVMDTEFNKPGQFNLNAGFAWGYGPGVDVGGEFILTKFDIPNFPMELGVALRAYVNFPVILYSGAEWGFAPMAMLHKGFHFGENADFELFIGAGVGVGGEPSGLYYTSPVGVGFATFDGIAWKLADKFWLQAEYGGVYGYQVSTSMASFGVRFEL